MANAPLDRGAFINPKKVIIMASRGVNKVILVGNKGASSSAASHKPPAQRQETNRLRSTLIYRFE